MNLIFFYLRKLFTVLKKEVLVLPSRIAVVLFFLFLLLFPIFTEDPYLLRIFTLTSIFAILAASWDLLSGFTGQMNFGHALFFGVGAYGAALLNQHAGIPPWGSIPLGALGAVLAGSDHRDTLPQAQRYVSGPDHPGLSHHPDGHRFCPS